ncbi:tail fiber assembly protein [Enterobacter roggenkampii]|uniref:tail fiber assembly protein n=1 Tax=Enterobacter roggenkampii TaxID=1812935 RepID=UPI003D700560
MAKAVLDKNNIATEAGDITVFNYSYRTREYLSSAVEHLAVGIGLPADSCTDAPGERKNGFAICRTADFTAWEYVADYRGEAVYSTETGEMVIVSEPGDYPADTTWLAPATPYDTWNGSAWVTDAQKQQVAVEQQKAALINEAMQSISVIQLKLQAGRKLTPDETTKLNATLDYIDAVTATDTSTEPDINWPDLPEL